MQLCSAVVSVLAAHPGLRPSYSPGTSRDDTPSITNA
jgi:hypothetical protein